MPPTTKTKRGGLYDDETKPLVRPSGRRPLGILIRVDGAPPNAESFLLREGACIVGSSPKADLVVQQPTVSRQHCKLELTQDGVLVSDMGSRNGTWFLGQRVERMTLAPGATIVLGSVNVHLHADVEGLGHEPALDVESYAGLIGRSVTMRRLFAVIERLREVLVPVLVEGESGVGKELVARALHTTSRVAQGPLVAVNCGATARELVASELFGHRRGAFTGAHEARKGAFDAANGGTLFLDELGELPLDVQPTLLRAIDTGEIQPIGAETTHAVRTRIVAATNRNLQEEVAKGRFREDLYFRLAVVPLRVPPLRERREDIEPLANHFARDLGLPGLEPSIAEQLQRRDFPGNVRELKNAVIAFSALGRLPEPPRIRGESLDAALSGSVDLGRPYAEQKDELGERFTRVYLAALLERTGGNQTVAARVAGLDRGYLGRLVTKYDLKR